MCLKVGGCLRGEGVGDLDYCAYGRGEIGNGCRG